MRFRFHSVTRYLLLASLSMPTSSLAAAPLNILWDDTHDGFELTNDETGVGGNYNDFRLLVEAEGHVLDEFNGPGDLTADLLADYDVLMFFDTEIDLTEEEVGAIQEWVSNGGLLFVAGETVTGTSFNEASWNFLFEPYHIAFTTPDVNLDLTVFSGDPLTDGLTAVDFSAGCTLTVSGAGTKVLASASDGRAGYAYGANGAVVVLADSDPFINAMLEPGDNEERLVKNLLGHFAGPDEPPAPAPPLEITIDVKPGTGDNPINPKSNGVVQVAILTTSVESGDSIDFDPWESVDPITIALGPGNAAPRSESASDVDLDGDLDMLLEFRTQEIGVECGLTELELTATTYDDDSLVGSDTIKTPGCQ
jgi:hypothetical protein